MEPDDVLVAPNTSATLPCLVDNKVLILHTDVKGLFTNDVSIFWGL